MRPAHQVEVHQIDRGPRGKQIQQDREQIAEAVDEVARGGQCQSGRRDETSHALADPGPDRPESVGNAQQRERSAVEVQRRYRHQAEQGAEQQHRPETGHDRIRGTLHGCRHVEARVERGGDGTDEHHPGAANECTQIGPPE